MNIIHSFTEWETETCKSCQTECFETRTAECQTTVNRRRLVWLVGKHQSMAANMLRIK